MTLLDRIFGDKTREIIQAAADCEAEVDASRNREQQIRQALNLDVHLARRVAQQKPGYFVELYSGLGVPTLALGMLGFRGEAWNTNMRAVPIGYCLAKIDLQIQVTYELRSVRGHEPKLLADTLVLAQRLAEKNEEEVIQFAKQYAPQVALVAAEPARTKALMERVINAGYAATAEQIMPGQQHQVIIGLRFD